MSRLVVISPHLDDAVFSCGTYLSAAATLVPVLVVTVCAGIPTDDVPAGGYDASCGFTTAATAMRARRAEDVAAAEVLGVDVLHLDVFDDQYDRGDDRYPVEREEKIRQALRPILATAGTFLSPLGIRHPDHLAVARAMRGRVHLVYEELPYRDLWPDEAPTTVGRLAHPLEFPTSPIKERAIACYRSQISEQQVWALGGNERIHRVRWTA